MRAYLTCKPLPRQRSAQKTKKNKRLRPNRLADELPVAPSSRGKFLAVAFAVRRFSALQSWLLVSVAIGGLVVGAAARAQPAAGRVGVVRSTTGSTPPELAETIDAALLRDLAGIAGVADPVVSPIDLAEIQLSVGCADDGGACLEAIARAAGVGALLVRSLGVDEQGYARVELRYFDTASSDEPRAVSAGQPQQNTGDLTGAIPGLVRELFGIPEVAAPAPATSEPVEEAQKRPAPSFDRDADRGASLLPWLFIGTGVAAVTVGVIVGAVASDDFEAWKARPVRTDEEAEQANDDFDDLQARAVGADVAMVGGAVTLALGVTLLAFQLGDDDEGGTDDSTVALEPRLDGALLRIQGALPEAW